MVNDNFSTFREINSTLSVESTDELYKEINKRDLKLIDFPLDVFHPNIKPFLGLIHREYDLPKAFIGLGMLASYSAAIGNAYYLRNKKLGDLPCSIWGTFVGISSSGKSILIKQALRPLFNIQNDYAREWEEKTKNMTTEKRVFERNRKIIFNDIFVPTLTRSVIPDNPKGLLKESDEILEWINSFNTKNGKEGTDEQFWLKCWNGSTHMIQRAQKDEVHIKKLFVSVIGGVQPTPKILGKLFANERATTGFIYRFLFAFPDDPNKQRVAMPNLYFEMPEELEKIHDNAIKALYFGLPVDDLDEDIKTCILSPQAIKLLDSWRLLKANKINHMDDVHEMNIHAGIFGKLVEYAMRFCVLLHISDKAYDRREFLLEEIIDANVMERALKLIDYFYQSALIATNVAIGDSIAPEEVLRYRSYLNKGYSFTKIGEMEYPKLSVERARKKAASNMASFIKKFPNVLGAVERK